MTDAGAGSQLRRSSRRLGPGLVGMVLLGAALAGAGIGLAMHFLLARPAPPAVASVSHNGLAGEATWAAGTRPAPPIATLRDQTGHVFSLASLRGRTVALVFFDSRCNQQCPLEGRELAAAERSLQATQRAAVVAVSVNMLDTPASARKAAKAWGLARVARWYWLMGSRPKLAAVWNAYHIYVGRPQHGDIPHTEALYLIDRRGDERSAYLYPFMQGFVAHDLSALARERKA